VDRAKNRRGRPTRLKPEVADRLVFAVANGASRTRAAADAGIGLRTLRDWIERGRAERNGQLVARIDAGRPERAATARPWPELLALYGCR
jgi:hypothetical protein